VYICICIYIYICMCMYEASGPQINVLAPTNFGICDPEASESGGTAGPVPPGPHGGCANDAIGDVTRGGRGEGHCPECQAEGTPNHGKLTTRFKRLKDLVIGLDSCSGPGMYLERRTFQIHAVLQS
jgi:hypothetical protein